MKQETKELIDGLKITLKDTAQDNDGLHWLNCKGNDCLSEKKEWSDRILKGEYNGCLSVDSESNYNKIIALLDSLEDLENQLKHGGFISDRNGKPCKDGDRVKIFANDEETTGTVKWISDCGYFLICSDGEDSYNWYLDELRDCGHGWFEKED